MLKILGKAFKILLILILIAGLAVGVYFLDKYMKWPWWVGASILAGIFGLIVAAIFLKKWLFRRREKKFVQRIVEQDEAFRKKLAVEERPEIRSLEQRWKEAMDVLRASHLRKYGNPLYVLPWYMIIGESGSGKSTGIHRARLHSPRTVVSAPAEIGVTKNVDWWFFEQAVVMDTAGRYVVPLDEAADKEEWKKLLFLLAKYRKKEPLNGVVVTVSVDRLIRSGGDEVVETARSIRRSIDELMRVLGAKFPVYILVTKIDQILGAVALAGSLPKESRSQALGYGNVDFSLNRRAMVDETITSVTERLKDLRLETLGRNRASDPGLLVFPEELSRLRSVLHQFIDVLFEKNPYQETPQLRGIYFSSGRQSGKASGQVLQEAGVLQDFQEELAEADQGYFLQDFFATILPADRFKFSHLMEFISWRRMTSSLGLIAWAAVVLAVCGLMTLSLVKNIQALNAFFEDFAKPPALSQNITKDLVEMDRFRQELVEMNGYNKGWWLPRLGLEQSRKVEQKLRNQFCEMFWDNFLEPLDKAINQKVYSLSSATPGDVVGIFTGHLATRINLLNARLKGASLSDLEKMRPPLYWALTLLDQKVMPQIAAEFIPLYISYLAWQHDDLTLDKERRDLRVWLNHVSTLQNFNLNWLVDYENTNIDLEDFTLPMFWGSHRLMSDRDHEEIKVGRAFTIKGREKIEETIKEYESALENPKVLEKPKKDFDIYYWREYVKAWGSFGQSFDHIYIRLGSEHDRRSLAETMADPNNPYFHLLETMALELEPVYKLGNYPDWVRSVMDFKKVREQAAHESILKSTSALTKVTKEGEKILQTVGQKVDQTKTPDEKISDLEIMLKAVEQLKEYEKALNEIIPVTTSREMAFKMAKEFFPSNQAATSAAPTPEGTAQQSPLQDANTALTKLKTYLVPTSAAPDNLFWKLITGPLDFLVAYMIQEAACELQYQWEGQVVAASRDLPEAKQRTALFDQQKGLVWQFVNGPAADFLGRDANGFYARKMVDQLFPFKNDFLAFLDLGSSESQMVLDEYKVSLTARPTSVNRDALLEPYATVLLLSCSDKPQQLENFNYPAEKTFNWEPDKCGAVTLDIVFNDFTVTKTYEGVNGFPKFLDDFRAGAKTFYPKDFPEATDLLTGIKVNEIRVTYVIKDSQPLIDLREKQQFQVPLDIAECWDYEQGKAIQLQAPPAKAPTKDTKTAPAKDVMDIPAKDTKAAPAKDAKAGAGSGEKKKTP